MNYFNKKIITDHLLVVCKLIADAEYHLLNYHHLLKTSDKETTITAGSFFLRRYRSIAWYLVVLDLSKLLNRSDNDKFNIWKLINIASGARYKQFWRYPIEIVRLKNFELEFSQYSDVLINIIDIRDKHIAHLDNVPDHANIPLEDFTNLLTFCKSVYNYISHCLDEGDSDWSIPDSISIQPIINKLSKVQ